MSGSTTLSFPCPPPYQARERSGAHVQVMSATGGLARLQLRGSPEQIVVAKYVLDNLATDCEPVTEVLDVPLTAFGRIIGKPLSFVLRQE